eukprot:scaffold620_cov177-Ochromonas_danica.AAC.11
MADNMSYDDIPSTRTVHSEVLCCLLSVFRRKEGWSSCSLWDSVRYDADLGPCEFDLEEWSSLIHLRSCLYATHWHKFREIPNDSSSHQLSHQNTWKSTAILSNTSLGTFLLQLLYVLTKPQDFAQWNPWIPLSPPLPAGLEWELKSIESSEFAAKRAPTKSFFTHYLPIN